MFIAGRSGVLEPPVNDLWTVPGEESLLPQWKKEDSEFFLKIDATIYYMKEQIEDFINALKEDREPLVTGEQGRKTVELFTAIYRSTLTNKPVQFPLSTESGKNMNGRIGYE
jgi:predicted dehydrogenase